jgi:uncharacterized protein YjbJ (UPF0337 family)
MCDSIQTRPAHAIKLKSGMQKGFDMNRDTVEGSWKQLKGKVKARWGKLTGSHLEVIDGKRVELSGKVQEGYGITKDAAEQQIERLEKRTGE